ncbi:hypothetical protein [Parafrankia sp. EUN1f]|uniref:hypothetical protein n=1 Tax=Parafrankia sp. EUN1f TaxID=102897 RepID=UPI0001C4645D|nr:hypothetical protein [Parafrankia sp. EUN1f]EFC80893.1 hypothetical protein FrEUN1fDRAFT_5995 [Parafrankia sp. EUN1f]
MTAAYTIHTSPGAVTVTLDAGTSAIAAAEALDQFRFSAFVFMDACRNSQGKIVVRLRTRRPDADGGFCSYQQHISAIWIHPEATVFEIQAALMRAHRDRMTLRTVDLNGAHTVVGLVSAKAADRS